MVNVFRVVTVGLTAAMLATAVGCSQGTDSTTTAPDASDPAVVDSVEADETEADVAEADEAATDSESDYRVVDDITAPAPGTDPLAMAFELRQFTGEAVGSEQIKVTYPAPDRAVVVSVVRGVPDDSVRAVRTRYEFASDDAASAEQQWNLVQVTQQNKCQPGKGAEDWTGDLCE
ncbi:MAG: hypothetical protein Kow00121_54700 [Elainellaceae cyanobacterium]